MTAQVANNRRCDIVRRETTNTLDIILSHGNDDIGPTSYPLFCDLAKLLAVICTVEMLEPSFSGVIVSAVTVTANGSHPVRRPAKFVLSERFQTRAVPIGCRTSFEPIIWTGMLSSFMTHRDNWSKLPTF